MSTSPNDYPKPALPTCPVPCLLKGQTALVTGANSGIGKAIAIALGQTGADVAVNYRSDKQAALGVVDTIVRAGSRGIAVHADGSIEEQVIAMFRRTIEALGTVDILVNNAGVQQDAPKDRRTGGHWPRCRFPGFRPGGLHHRRKHLRRRRYDALPRVLNRRIGG